MISLEGVGTTLAYGGSAGLGLALGFQFIKWLATFVAGRIDQKEASIDADMKTIIDLFKSEIARLSLEVADHAKELKECRQQHAEANAKIMALEAQIQGYGIARQHAAVNAAVDRKEAKS